MLLVVYDQSFLTTFTKEEMGWPGGVWEGRVSNKSFTRGRKKVQRRKMQISDDDEKSPMFLQVLCGR